MKNELQHIGRPLIYLRPSFELAVFSSFVFFHFMLIELFRVLIRFFRVISLLLPPNPFRPPDAIVEMFSAAAGRKALPANSDVEYANYKMFSAICLRAKESLQKAVNADETRKNKKGVILLYQSAIKDILAALAIRACSCPANKYTEISEQHQILSRYLESAQDRIMKLEGIAQQPVATATTTDFGFSRAASSNSNVCVSNRREPLTKAKILNGVSSKHGDEIFSTIISYSATDTKLTMNDVKGNIAAKAALEESVVLPALNPSLFTGLRAPCKGILLFGPPGNGKTMIAKAVANECQSTFFNISAATIMSKWVGEGERLVQALFQAARNAQPSIIFIDEVDSMLCERSENENGAARRVKTEFLIQLDGCAGKSDDRVLVLAATNRPYELDEGILRRFPIRIFIDLPDQRAREEMIRRTFEKSNTRVSLSRKDIDVMASKTAGYSYSDLNELCRCAALIPLRSMDRSTLSKLRAEELRPVCFQDMEKAWQTVKPSTNMENRQKLLEFARKYAQISE